MTLVVDLNYLLDEHGDLPTDDSGCVGGRWHRDARRVRRASRPTRRPREDGDVQASSARQAVPRLHVDLKRADDRIQAYCLACGDVEGIISGWQDSLCADGPVMPIPMTND